MMTTSGILYPYAADAGRVLTGRLAGLKAHFVCVVGHTDVCEVAGISEAGASAELRRYTAAADVEMLHYGRPRCLTSVPVNPLGPPSPVVITSAALRLASIPHTVVDTGLRITPDVPLIRLGDRPGEDIRAANAVPDAHRLFERGQALGTRLAVDSQYLVIGESVPGGTTTALALMLALGLDARGKVSSSGSGDSHALKNALVDEALGAMRLDRTRATAGPLALVSAIGDPMQPALAGLALSAAQNVPVLLAGGTQMAAVLALMAAITARTGAPLPRHNLAIATTRWVVTDPFADLSGLVNQIGSVPVLAADIDLSRSRHAGLRRYEDFLVKEGVGAGGAAVAAMLAGVTPAQLQAEIDRVLDELDVSA